jgi:peroxiredoxin
LIKDRLIFHLKPANVEPCCAFTADCIVRFAQPISKSFRPLVKAFSERGVGTIAISSDGQERTEQMAQKIGVDGLRFGYDLPLSIARDWGLYISTSRGKTSIGIEEPKLFAEPGLFMVSPDQTLYYASVQTMPFVRPHFSELIGALDFVIANNYPARGEYTGPV